MRLALSIQGNLLCLRLFPDEQTLRKHRDAINAKQRVALFEIMHITSTANENVLTKKKEPLQVYLKGFKRWR